MTVEVVWFALEKLLVLIGALALFTFTMLGWRRVFGWQYLAVLDFLDRQGVRPAHIRVAVLLVLTFVVGYLVGRR